MRRLNLVLFTGKKAMRNAALSDAAMKPKMFSAGLDWMMGDRQLPPTDKNKQKEPSHNEMTLYIITGNF